MATHAGQLRLSTTGDCAVVDLTPGVESVLRTCGIQLGVVCVFARGSTVAVTTIEYEPGAVNDLRALLERLAPRAGAYKHNELNGDTNGHAHVRAALLGPSVSIPLVNGSLELGRWQQVVLVDLDDRPRERTVTVHVTG